MQDILHISCVVHLLTQHPLHLLILSPSFLSLSTPHPSPLISLPVHRHFSPTVALLTFSPYHFHFSPSSRLHWHPSPQHLPLQHSSPQHPPPPQHPSPKHSSPVTPAPLISVSHPLSLFTSIHPHPHPCSSPLTPNPPTPHPSLSPFPQLTLGSRVMPQLVVHEVLKLVIDVEETFHLQRERGGKASRHYSLVQGRNALS